MLVKGATVMGVVSHQIKVAVKSRTKDIFIQELYDNKNNHNYCEISNVVKMEIWTISNWFELFPESRNVQIWTTVIIYRAPWYD